MLSYHEVLQAISEDKRDGMQGVVGGSLLLALEAMGMVKPKYNFAEKLIGHIRRRIYICVGYLKSLKSRGR